MKLTGRASRLVLLRTVRCVMCGRSPGQIVDAVFVRDQTQPPPRQHAGAARCGCCGGNLYLEVDASIPPAAAARLLERPTQPVD